MQLSRDYAVTRRITLKLYITMYSKRLNPNLHISPPSSVGSALSSMETTHNSVKVKLGIKVMKLVESLIGREVTVGQGSECHLTFVRGLLHIAQ